MTKMTNIGWVHLEIRVETIFCILRTYVNVSDTHNSLVNNHGRSEPTQN